MTPSPKTSHPVFWGQKEPSLGYFLDGETGSSHMKTMFDYISLLLG